MMPEDQKQCSKCGEWKLLGEYIQQLNYCHECRKKQQRENFHRPEVKAKARERIHAYQNNEHNKKRAHKYRHLPKIKIRNFVGGHNRRARECSLPDTLTVKEWQYALNYFEQHCAVCGHPLSNLFGKQSESVDHWIPISYKGDDNPGTVATNIVPLCNKCNSSKSNTLPDKWLEWKFGDILAKRIMTEIQAYFDSLG